jgi:hypothetical protein
MPKASRVSAQYIMSIKSVEKVGNAAANAPVDGA